MVNNIKKIEAVLKKNKTGYTISDLARKSNLSRNTVRVYIEKLLAQQKIEIKKIGPSKLIIIR